MKGYLLLVSAPSLPNLTPTLAV